jgi:hypothetical protein
MNSIDLTQYWWAVILVVALAIGVGLDFSRYARHAIEKGAAPSGDTLLHQEAGGANTRASTPTLDATRDRAWAAKHIGGKDDLVRR